MKKTDKIEIDPIKLNRAIIYVIRLAQYLERVETNNDVHQGIIGLIDSELEDLAKCNFEWLGAITELLEKLEEAIQKLPVEEETYLGKTTQLLWERIEEWRFQGLPYLTIDKKNRF